MMARIARIAVRCMSAPTQRFGSAKFANRQLNASYIGLDGFDKPNQLKDLKMELARAAKSEIVNLQAT